jgi:hypothetical protein
VVDKSGKLVWHGYPSAQMEKVIKDILAGTYDIQAAKDAEKARGMIDEYFGLVSKSGRGLFGSRSPKKADIEKAQ